ncbi:hypothetical protein BS47DRAFT_1388877 [Hydnum rufescens UP504]|uniref:Uncharacterized protein n=1 Tax=Hydnum rufescens UP504 TaxID=1448309 RepID=A0A9P6B6N3_9AGAM|nr:hypothetical protein BS47DRAFT_1388877 [Hydnum rufescens UP504]
MGGPGKKTKQPPPQRAPPAKTSPAEPPVMARKSSVVPSSGKKATSTKVAKATPENPPGDTVTKKGDHGANPNIGVQGKEGSSDG